MMRTRHNLPAAVASFVGRQQERSELARVMRHERLVTLSGVGGCGKTQLALRIAADLLPCFDDGVWLVELAPVIDAAQVPRAVAAALRVGGHSDQSVVDALVASLGSRDLLLVLDNCEHLIDACAHLAEALLRACPGLRILATSREPLRVAGEVVRRVPPLALPGADQLPVEALAEVEAIRLFIDRARARQPDFSLTVENAPVVAQICRRLEGLPLAIELAAAHTSVLALEQIASQLDHTLALPGGGSRTLPRQATLRATLDWSHALLGAAERVLFRRLAVFAGSFDAHAAEQVCASAEPEPVEVCASAEPEPADVLRLLTALTEKSLVEARVHAHARHARYRLLEPVRQYAWEHLVRHGEAATAQRRHAEHYVALAEGAEPELRSAQRQAALERLGANLDNLRAALAWSRRSTTPGDRELGLRLGSALFWFWNFHGQVSEGREWLETLLAAAHALPAVVRANALHAAGELTWLLGDNARARAYLEESVGLCRAAGDQRCLAYDLQALIMLREPPAARAAASESLRIFRELGDAWGAAHASLGMQVLEAADGDTEQPLLAGLAEWRALNDGWGVAQVLNMLGDLARSRGEDALARSRYAEALALLREVGITGTVPSLLHNLGYLALRGGDERRALRLFRESLALFRDQGDQRGIADCLDGVAGALGALQQPELAARLFGAAEAMRETSGASVWPANAADVARGQARVRAQLDRDAVSSAWAAGRAWSSEQAVAAALAALDSGQTLSPVEHDQLTPREREVASLVAQGMTNRQIGMALVITEGTARLHVKHILQKLEFRSRSQIAAWAVAQGIARPNGRDIPLRG